VSGNLENGKIGELNLSVYNFSWGKAASFFDFLDYAPPFTEITPFVSLDADYSV
jgi:hypothetical protein